MLKIEATKSTPEVIISFSDCIFSIKGYSFANDLDIFYKPVMQYIDKEINNIDCNLVCELYLKVFNSVTYKYILNIMSKFMTLKRKGNDIKIVWYYNFGDEDSKESAKDLDTLFNIPFEIKEITK